MQLAWHYYSTSSVPVQPSRFFQLKYEENVAQLVVAEAFSEDEGEYTCTATNSSGTESTSCYLTVEGTHLCTSVLTAFVPVARNEHLMDGSARTILRIC